MDFDHQQRDDQRKPSRPSRPEQRTFDPWEDEFRREYHPTDKEFEYSGILPWNGNDSSSRNPNGR